MAVKPFDISSFSKANFIDPKDVGYQDSIDIIYDELQKTRKSFIKIGWYLKHINETAMYEEDGYTNIYEFAQDKFNISQPTATRFINLCTEFSVGHDSPELDERYLDFSVSQLFEMLPMKQEEKEQITSDMTVKEIREIKKESKADKEPKDAEIKLFYDKFLKNISVSERENLKEYMLKHYGKAHAGGGPEPNYDCSLRGIKINNSDEITWTRFVNRVDELIPLTIEAEAVEPEEDDDNIPGQTSIEKDFPEYLPDSSHNITDKIPDKDEIVDAEYREVEENAGKIDDLYISGQEEKAVQIEDAELEEGEADLRDLRNKIVELTEGIQKIFGTEEIPREEIEAAKKSAVKLTIAIEELYLNVIT